MIIVVKTTNTDISIKWFPSKHDVFKLNIGDSSSYNHDHCGIGGVIRNSKGDWKVGYFNKRSSHYHTMVELEALEYNLTPLVIETDSVEVIHLIHQPFSIFQVNVEEYGESSDAA